MKKKAEYSGITNAIYLSEYCIEVEYENGSRRTIDMKNFLENSTNAIVRRFLNLTLFQQFRIEDGALVWGDNEFDINPMNIEVGKYDVEMRN